MGVRTAHALAGYRWRHFFPVAPDLELLVPFYKAAPGGGSVTENFRVEYEADGTDKYTLQSNIYCDNFPNGMRVFYNDVEQSNEYGLLYYNRVVEFGSYVDQPVYGYSRYEYDRNTGVITFRSLHNGMWWIDPPSAGTKVRIEITNVIDTDNLFVPIEMKPYLIQGANPMDPQLVTKEDPTGKQFQGGYRCTLHILKYPEHGVARVGRNQLRFEFRPDMGYYGEDEFTYFTKNSMGQESATGTVKLYIGINKPAPKSPTPPVDTTTPSGTGT